MVFRVYLTTHSRRRLIWWLLAGLASQGTRDPGANTQAVFRPGENDQIRIGSLMKRSPRGLFVLVLIHIQKKHASYLDQDQKLIWTTPPRIDSQMPIWKVFKYVRNVESLIPDSICQIKSVGESSSVQLRYQNLIQNPTLKDSVNVFFNKVRGVLKK